MIGFQADCPDRSPAISASTQYSQSPSVTQDTTG
ncbi:uncharacterized protein METZ01_LOCUS461966, partial [marine metagenome]